jgi:hypothetical protein
MSESVVAIYRNVFLAGLLNDSSDKGGQRFFSKVHPMFVQHQSEPVNNWRYQLTTLLIGP